MKITVKDICINYIQYGSGSKDMVLLHGWGQNIAMMKPIGDMFQDRYRITILDLPGFGESGEPSCAWSIADYADLLEMFLDQVHVKKPILMGHSFGGRIAIYYAATHVIAKLCLFGSPCIRRQDELPLKVRILKQLKKVPGLNRLSDVAKQYIGSRDYKAASPVMRDTLVQVVNQDLSEYARKISVPTLLIWGENDEEAPVEEARELEHLIPDAGLIVFPGFGHYAYLENRNQVYIILDKFL